MATLPRLKPKCKRVVKLCNGSPFAHIGRMAKLNQEKRDDISDDKFAFPKEGKEPIHDAAHVRNAIARFNQLKGVTDAERDAAWERIRAAAKKFDVELEETDWRDLAHGGKNMTAHTGGSRGETHKAQA